MKTKIIGRCKECHYHAPSDIKNLFCYHKKVGHGFTYEDNRMLTKEAQVGLLLKPNEFGCWYWKEKKC